ncbi:hypothetical protein FRC06_001331 [Ceratobasidium sp. 370]|nr:hypothetical protein FRC06_001331 [Ceratobasidium sp. 370]
MKESLGFPRPAKTEPKVLPPPAVDAQMYFLGRSVSRIVRPVGVASVRNLAASNAPINLLTIHPEVADALARGTPVVALESTVITHGLVYPDNLKTAISCEENIRANGAIPATIGLLEGRMHVGLERKQLEILADVESLKKAGKAPIKLSRRDIAPAMSLGRYGGTTIAGTTVIAHLAGIKAGCPKSLQPEVLEVCTGVVKLIFTATIALDISAGMPIRALAQILPHAPSADLTELGRTPIAVVASGAKSILDIGRTLEYLETQGVTVAAYDNDGNWPAFFSARSGYKAPWAFNDSKDAAKAIYYADRLGIQSGTIFGVPIPKEFEKAGLEIQAAVDQAVRESEENGIAKSGRDATPWLLSRVKDITKGLSLPSNIALLENNARVGARIAVEYAKLKAGGAERSVPYQPAIVLLKPSEVVEPSPAPDPSSPLVIVGAAAVDIIAQPYSDSPSAIHSTAPGSVRMSPGGVARNVAEAAHRVLESLSTPDIFESHRPLLISPIGNDAFASVLTLESQSRGMRIDGLMHLAAADERTATCNMFLDARGDLQMGIADMSIIGDAKLDVGKLLVKMETAAPRIVAFDGNPSSGTITSIIQKAKQLGAMIPALLKMVESAGKDPHITGAFPNLIELRAMWETARSEEQLLNSPYWWSVVDTFEPDLHRVLSGQVRGDMLFLLSDGVIQMAIQLLPFIKHFVIKCGSKGVALISHVTDKEGVINWVSEGSRPKDHQIVSRASDGSVLVVRHFPAYALPESLSTINVTGADGEHGDEPVEVKKDDPDWSSNSENSDNDESVADAQMDREIEKLMYEASDTDSDPGSKEKVMEGEKANNRDTRHALYDSAAMNISMLVLTCWWVRVPATYLDFIGLINSYRIPYLDVVLLLPENMKKHLSVALRQQLNPPHAPTVIALHVITRRIARRLRGVHGINIPEFNAAPVLWRAVRAFQGPPMLYTMAKQMMERLEVPLTIYPSLAPKPSSGKSGFGGDWAPVEVTMAAVLVLVLKLVYGFQEGIKVTPDEGDPASCFPDFSSYMNALRRGKAHNRMDFSMLLSRGNDRTADTLCGEEVDKYLGVAEKALATWSMGDARSMPFKQLMAIYGDIQNRDSHTTSTASAPNIAVPPEALERPSLAQNMEDQSIKLPGESIINWSPNDPLGMLPPDYGLLIETASVWSGVEQSTINRLVGLFEKRLQRYSPKRRRLEISDLDMDNEYLDLDQRSQHSGSEGGLSTNIKYEDEDKEIEIKTSAHGYRLGSRNWRQRVHNKLSTGNRSKGAYKQSSPDSEGGEPESEDGDLKPDSKA